MSWMIVAESSRSFGMMVRSWPTGAPNSAGVGSVRRSSSTFWVWSVAMRYRNRHEGQFGGPNTPQYRPVARAVWFMVTASGRRAFRNATAWGEQNREHSRSDEPGEGWGEAGSE